MYTVTVHNRYAELCTDNDNITEKYAHFVNENSETAVKLIPIKKQNKDNKITSDPRIEEMRQNVNKAFAAFNFESNDRLQQELQVEKIKMKEMYTTIQEEELDEMIKQVDTSDNRHKYKESWELIIKITGRKTDKKGLIKGNSKEERVNRWFEHLFGETIYLVKIPY